MTNVDLTAIVKYSEVRDYFQDFEQARYGSDDYHTELTYLLTITYQYANPAGADYVHEEFISGGLSSSALQTFYDTVLPEAALTVPSSPSDQTVNEPGRRVKLSLTVF